MATASPSHRQSKGRGTGLRWSAWNLLLLVPLLMLVTSWFNTDQPRLLGLPFFYWYQLLFVPVGVICVGVVYVMTRRLDNADTRKASRLDVDTLDSGSDDKGEQR